jgi:hypothetical protein
LAAARRSSARVARGVGVQVRIGARAMAL